VSGTHTIHAPAPAPPSPDPDAGLLAGLRAGDQAAFAALLDRHATAMLRVAQLYVPSRAIAEEVVQDTWLAAIQGLDAFEGRSSLKTWLFTILANRAKTRGARERRTVPFATLAAAESDRWPHHWASPPRRWEESPELSLEGAETLALVRGAIAHLPAMQRLVITMRDLEDWDAVEVRDALAISESNQRVLLHRARSKVREALDPHLAARSRSIER
jgi:RNA polymerase sigma-70 factor (ECF subfamily)